jgi:hypothetical protein
MWPYICSILNGMYPVEGECCDIIEILLNNSNSSSCTSMWKKKHNEKKNYIIMCLHGLTCLPVNSRSSELVLWKSNLVCWSNTKWTSSSSRQKVSCSCHVIADKMLIWWYNVVVNGCRTVVINAYHNSGPMMGCIRYSCEIYTLAPMLKCTQYYFKTIFQCTIVDGVLDKDYG